MPVFLKICKLLINSIMRFVKNEFLTPHLSAFIIVFFDLVRSAGWRTLTVQLLLIHLSVGSKVYRSDNTCYRECFP